MPRRALRPCAHPGCKNLVGRGRCEDHRRKKATLDAEADIRRRGTSSSRGYGRDWERVRGIKLAADPLCERCLREGRTKPADMVHHRTPVDQAPELRLDLGNLESLCDRCHARTHAEMALEGL